ncbi:hypothetical protein DPM19_21255 [Actinomadura craniellae]|uniref:Uncharacterized protein n=1 Tax=Actinomadura craniellae TaxID=2231787 RepID=A0A365H1Q5_9ACTN|nr:DUF6069 family protein [Actinomadura craniellae]RAY13035.1 hypothetical protein DPM19_21255 [Actinomadura craniellae]
MAAAETHPGPTPAVRRRDRALAVAGSVVAALVVWLVAGPILGDDMVVAPEGRESGAVPAGAVLVFALVSSLLGWAALAVLERLARARAKLIWTILAIVVLVVSMAPVLDVEATGETKVALALMHVAVAAVLIPGFWRTTD